ncbi:uncharacterized protein LOC125785780 [Astyanax mexicanus]|uniref:uncharacterized protein LOC125785780 n=1 Tax=Astyanax mexicanus TaxID=7994 RepID=UPI0020CB491A|nr:uncharacterized protein LOC125785780 [Astyanax mexicanus]
MKYLCRGACSWGTKDIPVESGSTAKDQRFSLKDDTAARVFTITITDLRSEDAGQYWCVIQRSLPQRDVYTEILLLVKLDDPKSTIVPRTTFSNTPEPSTGSTGPAVLYVVVSLQALGIALGVLLFLCKRRKPRDAVISDRSQTDVGGVKDEADCENDPPRNQNSVYQSLNPNTNQSYSIYQTLNHNIKQSDSVYQSLNLNTNRSDSIYQTLNPSINQSNMVYQSLNPKTNQSDSVYYSLKPNINQLDSVY